MSRDQRGGNERGHAKIGAVRESGEETKGKQGNVTWCQRACEIADGQEAHQRQQQPMTRPTRSHYSDERRTDHNAERVGADGMPCCGYRNAEVTGNTGQQAHHDELAGADAEAAYRQRNFRPSRAAPRHCT